MNSSRYAKLTRTGRVSVASSEIRVGDLVYVDKGHRVPADMVLLRTTEHSGSCFVRTDQLDGETDWKLKLAVTMTQKAEADEDLLMGAMTDVSAYAEKPQKDIYSFIGKISNHSADADAPEEPLNVENTLWANTVVASGTALGLVVYTGPECRAIMNTSTPKSKVGLIDLELNQITKVLFAATMGLSLLMMCLKGFDGPWYIYLFRFVLLFSYIIPISLRVNLDVGKVFFSWCIMIDKEIPGTVARSTTIPEELGRISYLLTDKTGTLTQNNMVFKKLHLGTAAYSSDTFDEIIHNLRNYFTSLKSDQDGGGASGGGSKAAHQHRLRRTAVTRVAEAVKAITLCHNVTPVYEGDADDTASEADRWNRDGGDRASTVTYQAASPDEVALVQWSEEVGLTLVDRDLHSMKLRAPATGDILSYTILQTFPFTSESKRMGIILQDDQTGERVFYLKGADTVMSSIVQVY